jgi:DNA-binding XRE family transcriptional regulator
MRSAPAVADGNTLAERLAASRLPTPLQRRNIRIAAGASLRDVARELDVTPMTVARWEAGSEPRLAHAIAYRRLLDQLREVA